MKFAASIIICTKNRADSLGRTLTGAYAEIELRGE